MAAVAMSTALLIAAPAVAWAAWAVQGSGESGAKARALGGGSTPTPSSVNVPSGNVTLTWASSSIVGGGPAATSYLLYRYDARTGSIADAGNPVCTTTGTTCSESSVPTTGTWRYAVAPRLQSWVGATSTVSGDVNVGPPMPQSGSVLTVNGGTSGAPDQGDTISVSFTQRLSVSTLCSTWTDNAADQSITANGVVTVSLVKNGGGTGRDSLTVSTTGAACGAAPRFGTFNLGGGYVTATRTCSGSGTSASTVSWTAATSTLIVRLGACGATKSLASSTITYTPAVGVTNSTGTAVTGTATSAAGRQF